MLFSFNSALVPSKAFFKCCLSPCPSLGGHGGIKRAKARPRMFFFGSVMDKNIKERNRTVQDLRFPFRTGSSIAETCPSVRSRPRWVNGHLWEGESNKPARWCLSRQKSENHRNNFTFPPSIRVSFVFFPELLSWGAWTCECVGWTVNTRREQAVHSTLKSLTYIGE